MKLYDPDELPIDNGPILDAGDEAPLPVNEADFLPDEGIDPGLDVLPFDPVGEHEP